MARLMGYKWRKQFLRKVVELLPEDASTVLDIGCGVGLIRTMILERIPKASVIGYDMSWHMLTHQVSPTDAAGVSLVQGVAPSIPFKENSFDAVVAVQFTSEVFCFSGEKGFFDTIDHVKRVLREGGVFVVLDHQSPGDGDIEVRLSKDMVQKLKQFQALFQVRDIDFEVLSDGWIRMKLRDLYDFLTKIWSFDTALEEEEMQESHTSYTGEEFVNFLLQEGFSVKNVDGVVDFEDYLKRYKIDVRTKINLPSRFFIVSAES